MSERICFPRIILNDSGVLQEVPRILSLMGYRTPMILSGCSGSEKMNSLSLSRQLDIFRIKHRLFDDIPAEPQQSDIDKGVKRFFSGSDSLMPDTFDVIIALGSGSVIDLAKSISTYCSNNRAQGYPRSFSITGIQIPLIAIPTTFSYDTTLGLLPKATGLTPMTASENHLSVPVAIIQDTDLISQTPQLQLIKSAARTLLKVIDYIAFGQPSPFRDQQHHSALMLLNTNLPLLIPEPDNSDVSQSLQLASMLPGSTASGNTTGPLEEIHRTLCDELALPRDTIFPELLTQGIEYAAHVNPKRFVNCAKALTITNQREPEKSTEMLAAELKHFVVSLRFPPLSCYGLNKQTVSDQVRSVADQLTQRNIASVTNEKTAAP